MTPQPFWENAYKNLRVSTFGEPSQEIRAVAEELRSDAKVLDLGCGEGRNALFLAQCGFDVTAVDISEAGIRKVEALARERKLDIHAEVADMRHYSFAHAFDLIVSHGCLHLIERESWQQLIALFKTHTEPGGTNAITVITDAIPPPDDLKEHCLGLFREGELFAIYSDCNRVLERSYVFEDKHPGSPPHTHPLNKLVARKPSSKTHAGDPAPGEGECPPPSFT